MFLDLSRAEFPMKLVYQLSEELKVNTERVALTQSLTLDASRPFMGLKGSCGLFGSEEWWKNINNGAMPTLRISGVVQKAYVAGQESSCLNNTIDLVLDDGSSCSVGIYVNDENDISLFRVGAKAEIFYALDELKNQPGPDGGVNYSKVAIEMAVSQ